VTKLDVFLDDVRDAPDGWHRCRAAHEVIALLKAGRVRRLSLDHDLGEGSQTGYHVVLWMAEGGRWPDVKPVVHSMNPVGAQAMRFVIDRYWTCAACGDRGGYRHEGGCQS
jgi:hypothetical protein